jgi:hypothetical protein
METTTTRATLDLQDLMDEHLTTSNLVTRETGRSMRELIELRLEREPEGTVVALDFSHVGIIDFSCADEIISKRSSSSGIKKRLPLVTWRTTRKSKSAWPARSYSIYLKRVWCNAPVNACQTEVGNLSTVRCSSNAEVCW